MSFLRATAILGLLTSSLPPIVIADSATTEPAAIFKDPTQSPAMRANDLVQHMTLDEKVSQMVHDAPGIDRLGIPPYRWWNECLHGVLTTTATVFPQVIGLSATYDTDLISEVSTAISDEARAKNNDPSVKDRSQVMGLDYWSPNINIFRDPRWGRGQETYGEDPYLTARMATTYVKGLQGNDPKYLKVISTPKHYAVHSGPDAIRTRFDARTNDHDLWDTYLPAFEACVREGGAYSIMGAYNRTNGVPCCANTFLLDDILRKKWGFPGYVVSDCGAITNIYRDHKVVKTAEEAVAMSVKAGCDLNCGETYKAAVSAVNQGLLTEEDVNRSVKRLFEARIRLGMFDPPEMVPYTKISPSVVDSPEHRALALKAARESMVLLKNDNSFLPLKKNLKTVAVIGPNADDAEVMDGNYSGTPTHRISPLQGIKNKLGPDTNVIYVKACERNSMAAFEEVPTSALRLPDLLASQSGLRGEYFNAKDFTSGPVLTRIDPTVSFNWPDSPGPGVNADRFSVRWTGKLVPPVTGDYELGMTADDGARLYLDGKKLFENWKVHAARTTSAHVKLKANHTYDIKIEFFDNMHAAVAKFVWVKPAGHTFEPAMDAVRKADAAIVVLGIAKEIEYETHDRDDIALPKVQRNLLSALNQTGKLFVVVFENGGPISFDGRGLKVPAILEAWYPGQEGGTAIADVLFGDYNPAGRLPVTVYKSAKDLPDIKNYSMKNRTYRYFTGKPMYPFGFGLNYTKFAYNDLNLSSKNAETGTTITVTAKVKNTGKVAGDEVAQLYVRHESARNELVPLRELEGFRRVHLEPGDEQIVEFTLAPRNLSIVGSDGVRREKPGRIRVSIGGRDSTFNLAGDTVVLN